MNNTPDYNDNLYFEEKKMNDLTEQWKKGELNRNKIYYYETPFNTTDTASGYWLCNHCDTEKDKIEILGEVPSYDAYMAFIRAIDNVTDDNAELKDLLKECSHVMSIEKDFASCHFEKDKLTKLLSKIDEVVK